LTDSVGSAPKSGGGAGGVPRARRGAGRARALGMNARRFYHLARPRGHSRPGGDRAAAPLPLRARRTHNRGMRRQSERAEVPGPKIRARGGIVLLVVIGAVAACSTTRREAGKAGAAAGGGGTATAEGVGGRGAATSGGAGKGATACASSTACGPGRYCTTEDGACDPPPGCGPGEICAALCHGVCAARVGTPGGGKPGEAGRCEAAADCRLFADTCTGCDCRALASTDSDPACAGPGVRCFADPCLRKVARCEAGRCVSGVR
jgi:hypothetical protein